MDAQKPMPTREQAESLVLMAQHFNHALFDDELDLSRLLICWTRQHQVTGGHFATNKWEGEPDPETGEPMLLHELAINANVMRSMTLTQLAAVMVHEMGHALAYQKGKAGRPGYHNAMFCDMMRAIGLPQKNVATGEPVQPGSGAHSCGNLFEADPGTLFNRALVSLPEEAVPPYSSDPEPEDEKPQGGGAGGGEGQGEDAGDDDEKPQKRGARSKYTCVVCGLNAWAKPGASLLCGCNAQPMIEQV